MNLKEAVNKIKKDFDAKKLSGEKIKKILDEIDGEYQFLTTLPRDLNNFERLKMSKIFAGVTDNSRRGWLDFHRFPITLEILNKEKVPGGKVVIQNWGGQETNLLVYHGLCPELENFISLDVWLQEPNKENPTKKVAH